MSCQPAVETLGLKRDEQKSMNHNQSPHRSITRPDQLWGNGVEQAVSVQRWPTLEGTEEDAATKVGRQSDASASESMIFIFFFKNKLQHVSF